MKVLRNHAIFITLVLVLLFGCTRDKTIVQPDRTKTIEIGGLFSISTNLTALGQDSKAAMELAVEDMNAVFAKNNRSLRIAAMIEDTQLDPTRAVTLLKAQAGKGITCFIGPSSSAEVEAVKPYADANNILVISHYSTAGRLAINDDSIFRFCPSDMSEGPAIAALSTLDGITALVPLWRNDAGNQGLHDAVKTAFEAKGGTYYSGYRYEPTTTDYTVAAAQIRTQVDQAIAQKGSAKVAVYAASFDEIVTIMKTVATDPVLSSIKWYCGDGVALNEALIQDATAAAVAAQTRAESPNLSYDQSATAIWQPLEARIKAKTGNDGNPFALAVYDAVCVLANTLAITEGANISFANFKQEFVRQANAYSGTTGATTLNAAGDRKTGNYDFWRINKAGNTSSWVKSAYYDGTHDKATRVSQ
jgi:branched-chain amino acid transport system substrate-binding protein